MGLAVVGERSLWLSLSGLSEKEKVGFLDAPIDPKAQFGATVTVMWQQCDLRKREGEAFGLSSQKAGGSALSSKPAKFQTLGESRSVSPVATTGKCGRADKTWVCETETISRSRSSEASFS